METSTTVPVQLTFFATIRHRIVSYWRLKVILSIAMTVGFCVPYFLLGNYPLFPVHEIAPSRIDRTIGFHPDPWVWGYQSLYLVLNLIPWLADRREQLLRMAKGFFLLAAVSFTVFLFYPTHVPKPAALHASAMFRLLRSYDTPLNALPSLHAGLLVYVLAFGRRIFRDTLALWTKALFIIWGGLILYGTLATKEHYLIDIAAGSLLALAVDAWACRGAAASRRIRIKSGEISHDGRR
jgi:hypothetical protein